MSKIWGFDHIKDKHTLYSRKDCMKKFYASLREHARNIIDFEKKKMIPLTKEELKPHQDTKVCYICGKIILKRFAKDKNIENSEIIVIIQVNIEAQHIVFVT